MSHSYRKRVETIDAVQFDGANSAELLAFAPDYLEMRDGLLCQKMNPFPIATTEWVFQYTMTLAHDRMANDLFQRTWQPGGAAP
jgi:hypothetical protein